MKTEPKDKRQPTVFNYANRLRKIANHLEALGIEMEYFGGAGPIGTHGRNMQRSAYVMKLIAKDIK